MFRGAVAGIVEPDGTSEMGTIKNLLKDRKLLTDLIFPYGLFLEVMRTPARGVEV